MSPVNLAPSARRHRWYRWVLAFPFIWQAGLAPVVNDVRFTPFGLPFPMVWQLAGIVMTSAVIAWVFWRDRKAGVDAEESAFLASSAADQEEAR